MKSSKFLMCAAVVAAAAFLTSCKDDKEPGVNPSDVQGLFVNEVCSGGTDWIELYNASDEAVDLSGYHVQDSKGTDEEYTFPAGSGIDAKGFIVIEEGTFEFGISGDGDAITLLDENYAVIDNVILPAMEDGYTYARTEDGGSSWEIVEGGTKGRSNSGTPDDMPEDPEGEEPGDSDSPVLVNEVQGATLDGQTDFIELYNPSSGSVDISGYRLQDEKGAEEEYTIPDGTVIEAGAIMVFYNEESFTFGLGGSGDAVTVLDAEGNVVDAIEYPEMEDGSSYARIPDGSDNWSVCTAPTPGESNGDGETGGGSDEVDYTVLKLNEINGNDKFVEIYNNSDTEIDIAGVYFSKEDEEGKVEVVYTADGGTVIAARGFLTVWSEKAAEDDPDLFPVFTAGLSADKAVKIELFSPDDVSLDVFRNPLKEGEKEDGVYDSKDKGSFARETDGTGDWYIMTATEGASNSAAEKVEDEKIEW